MSNEDLLLLDPYDEISDILTEWLVDSVSESVFKGLVSALRGIVLRREAALCEARSWEERAGRSEISKLRGLLQAGLIVSQALDDALTEGRSTSKADMQIFRWRIAALKYFYPEKVKVEINDDQ